MNLARYTCMVAIILVTVTYIQAQIYSTLYTVRVCNHHCIYVWITYFQQTTAVALISKKLFLLQILVVCFEFIIPYLYSNITCRSCVHVEDSNTMDDTLCETSSPKEDLSCGMLKYNYRIIFALLNYNTIVSITMLMYDSHVSHTFPTDNNTSIDSQDGLSHLAPCRMF